MVTLITSFITSQIAAYAAGGVGVVIVGWLLKRIPNEKIKLVVGKVGYHLGVVITLGLSKWRFTAKIWNKIVEPYFVDLIDNVIGEFVKEFIRGLRSDNPKEDVK